jgi:hypothetical protein
MESEKRSDPSKASQRGNSPRYFHLIWDDELDELQDALQTIQKHRAEVLEHWYSLYLLHFADSRALNRTEFIEIFGSELDTTLKDLIDKDLDRFAGDLRRMASCSPNAASPSPS